MSLITTDRLEIRESSGRDFSRIYAMMRSVAADETTDTVSADEDEELEKYLAYIHTAYRVFGFGLWSVCLKKEELQGLQNATEKAVCFDQEPDEWEPPVIGRCGLQAIADENSPLGRIELGYLIDESFRGQGYGYEACSAIADYAFRVLELDELYVNISPRNRASAALAEKLGFVRGERENLWVLRKR